MKAHIVPRFHLGRFATPPSRNGFIYVIEKSGPDRAPSSSSMSPTSRLGSDRSTCLGAAATGDPIDRVGVSCGLAESGLHLAGERCQQVIEASSHNNDQSREQMQSAQALQSEVGAG